MKTMKIFEALKKNFRKNIPLISFLGLILFIALLHRNNFNIPLTRDEGEYAYSAWLK